MPGRSDPAARASWIAALAGAGLAAAGLVLSNPSPADFQAFAAERLVEEIGEELCGQDGLPLLLRMAVANCPQVVRDQQGALASVVASHTKRLNLGLFSLYRSAVGGQTVLGWRLPRLRSTVLGIAGQFVLVQVSSDRDSLERAASERTSSLN